MEDQTMPESVCITPADPNSFVSPPPESLDLVLVYPVENEGQTMRFDSKEFENFLRKELSL